jgi:hypothetical protein
MYDKDGSGKKGKRELHDNKQGQRRNKEQKKPSRVCLAFSILFFSSWALGELKWRNLVPEGGEGQEEEGTEEVDAGEDDRCASAVELALESADSLPQPSLDPLTRNPERSPERVELNAGFPSWSTKVRWPFGR